MDYKSFDTAIAAASAEVTRLRTENARLLKVETAAARLLQALRFANEWAEECKELERNLPHALDTQRRLPPHEGG